MELLIFLIILLWWWIDDLCQKHDSKKAYQTYSSQGAFYPSTPSDVRAMITSDCTQHFLERCPPDIVRYVATVPNAKNKYITAMINEEEIRRGYKPSFLPGMYNKITFDPYGSFYKVYGAKIDHFKQTGEILY